MAGVWWPNSGNHVFPPLPLGMRCASGASRLLSHRLPACLRAGLFLRMAVCSECLPSPWVARTNIKASCAAACPSACSTTTPLAIENDIKSLL